MPTPTRRRTARPEPELPALPFDGFGPEAFELTPPEGEGEGAEIDEAGAAGATTDVGAAAATVSTRAQAMARAERLFEAWAPRVGRRLGWLGLAVVLALGSAGVLAETSPTPDTGFRSELTYGNDRQLVERLDAALHDLTAVGQDVEALGGETRSLLAYVTQVNRKGLTDTYLAAERTLASIAGRSAELSSSLECSSWTAARTVSLKLVYDGLLVDRWRLACVAVGSVAPLDESWKAMVNGSQVAMSVADGIAGHDGYAGQALQAATQGHYPEALGLLQQATNALAGTKRIATSFTAAGRDVSTLNQWLGRIDAMDIALGMLWQAMVDSKGKITPEVTASLRTVAEAQALLPQTNAVLSVVLYELADNLIAEGISIEQARGQFAIALAALAQNPIKL